MCGWAGNGVRRGGRGERGGGGGGHIPSKLQHKLIKQQPYTYSHTTQWSSAVRRRPTNWESSCSSPSPLVDTICSVLVVYYSSARRRNCGWLVHKCASWWAHQDRTASAIDGRRAHWRQVLLCKICPLYIYIYTLWIKG